MSAEPRKPVRILHVVRPAAGGMRQHVLQLATGLADAGFDAEIACPGDSDVVQSALAAGVEVRPVPIVGPLRPFRDIEAVIVLADIIRGGRFDIIHAHGSKAGLIGRVAAMVAGARRRVVTVHNDVLGGSVGSRMRRVVVFAERWLSRHTSRIITVSEALRRSMLDEVGADPAIVVTVHNGLDLGVFLAPADPVPVRERYGVPRDAVVLGQAARFAPQKAHDRLIAAAVPVLERVPNTWLVLAGDGPLLEPAKRQAAASTVADRIVFPGYETDIRGFLASIDVFVSAPASEGLGNAAIEAMAAAIPVVSTRTGGIPEVVVDGETGVLVEPGDSAALTEAMVRLARDAVLRRTMGEAGRVRAVEEFAEERMLARTAELYREVLCSDS